MNDYDVIVIGASAPGNPAIDEYRVILELRDSLPASRFARKQYCSFSSCLA